MTPELGPLPDSLPDTLRWTHTQRRTAWLFADGTCVGSLGFNGHGRASGLTSRGVWHLQRMGVLHRGVNVAPADGRHPPLMMRQALSFDGVLDLPGGEPLAWRALGGTPQAWTFERTRDAARLLAFSITDSLHPEIVVAVSPAVRSIADASPLLLLGAFLVRLAVDDGLVIAGR